MKNKFCCIKIYLLICDIICIILSVLFFCQIRAQKNVFLQIKVMPGESLTKKNNNFVELEETAFDIQDFFVKSKELEEELNEAEGRYDDMETVYQIRQYIDSISAQICTESRSSEYIDRYFRLEKGKLQEIVNDYNIVAESELFPAMIQESEMILPVGEQMWLRYEAGTDNGLPFGLLIQNPIVDIGYQNARAGMSLSDIKRSYPTGEKYSSLDWGDICYLLYEDDSYQYYYISVNRNNSAILYIEPNDRL